MLGKQTKRDFRQNGQDMTRLLSAAKYRLPVAGHSLHGNGYSLGPS